MNYDKIIHGYCLEKKGEIDMEKDTDIYLYDMNLRSIKSEIKNSDFAKVFHYKGKENADEALEFLKDTEGRAEIDKYRGYSILYFIKIGRSRKNEGVMTIPTNMFIVKYPSGKIYYYDKEELDKYYFKFSDLKEEIENKLDEVYKEITK